MYFRQLPCKSVKKTNWGLILRIIIIYNRNMIICVCKNISSEQLQDCRRRGMSLAEIAEQMGLGSRCGSCLEYACQLLRDEAATHEATTKAA